jgi:hypothetical protein
MAPDQFLEQLPSLRSVQIEGRTVRFRVWRYSVTGALRPDRSAYLIDTGVPENDP